MRASLVKLKKLSIAVSSALLATSVQAYQFEAGFSVNSIGLDEDVQNREVTSDSVVIAGVYHFEDVSTDKGPLQEAAFLDKSSFIGLAYDDGETENENKTNKTKTTADQTELVIGARQVISDFLILEQAYSQEEDNKKDSSTLVIGVGGYLDDSQELVGSIAVHSEDDKANKAQEFTEYGLRYKSIFPVGDMQLQTLSSFSYAQFDDAADSEQFTSSIGAELYITNQLAVSAQIAWVNKYSDTATVDVEDKTTLFGAGVSYFVNESFEISGGIVSAVREAERNKVDTVDASGAGIEYKLPASIW